MFYCALTLRGNNTVVDGNPMCFPGLSVSWKDESSLAKQPTFSWKTRPSKHVLAFHCDTGARASTFLENDDFKTNFHEISTKKLNFKM
jgi:hypothetical protein